MIEVCCEYLSVRSLAKWMSVCLQTKWLWLRVQLQLLKLQISRLFGARSILDIQATIEWRFTLKRVCDMIKTYSQSVFITRKFTNDKYGGVDFKYDNSFFKIFS